MRRLPPVPVDPLGAGAALGLSALMVVAILVQEARAAVMLAIIALIMWIAAFRPPQN